MATRVSEVVDLRAVLLMKLVALIASVTGATAPPPRVLAVLKELDRISARPLWPGFENGVLQMANVCHATIVRNRDLTV